MNDGLLTVTEAAAYLSVHRNTVLRVIRRGELPVFQVSTRGDYRIKLRDLDAWLEARRAV